MYSSVAAFIKLIVGILPAAPEAAWRNFPFSTLCAYLLRFSFGFGPASECRLPSGACSLPREEGAKAAADSGSFAHSVWE